MLTCVYHPIDKMRVVEHEEAECLKATGVWFDCPAKARNYREKVEMDVRKESKATQENIKKINLAGLKDKSKEKGDER